MNRKRTILPGTTEMVAPCTGTTAMVTTMLATGTTMPMAITGTTATDTTMPMAITGTTKPDMIKMPMASNAREMARSK